MQTIKPVVLHLASTHLHQKELQSYLEHIGIPDWTTDAPSDAEALIEVGGRSCYKSFLPGLNKNVTKVREGNRDYLANILKVKHGSVIEHAYDTYMFMDVSRVFTHELVRHRIGTDFSQESLRYVRLDHLKAYYPRVFQELDVVQRDAILAEWTTSFTEDEDRQVRIAQILKLDDPNLNFKQKKKLTSAMRRMAPIGLATNIMFTTNHRSMRFVIQQRTSREAEEEIREVFALVFQNQYINYPNLYQDAKITMVDGIPEVTFQNEKI